MEPKKKPADTDRQNPQSSLAKDGKSPARYQEAGRHRAGQALVTEMNELLANESLLFIRTLNFHWNITGPRFYSLHVFLEGQYRSLLEMMDEVAERIRYLGARPLSTLKEMKSEGSLNEDPGHFPGPTEMLAELCEGHEAVNKQIQSMLEGDKSLEEDQVSQDFLTNLQGKHQKMIWMLRSHLETEGTPLVERSKIN